MAEPGVTDPIPVVVPMMRIGHMRMRLGHVLVAMPMGMRSGRHRIVRVRVVSVIVFMGVLVVARFVCVCSCACASVKCRTLIMLLYLKQAWGARVAAGATTEAELLDAIRDGAVLRVRPKALTVAVITAGLLPIM